MASLRSSVNLVVEMPVFKFELFFKIDADYSNLSACLRRLLFQQADDMIEVQAIDCSLFTSLVPIIDGPIRLYILDAWVT